MILTKTYKLLFFYNYISSNDMFICIYQVCLTKEYYIYIISVGFPAFYSVDVIGRKRESITVDWR